MVREGEYFVLEKKFYHSFVHAKSINLSVAPYADEIVKKLRISNFHHATILNLSGRKKAPGIFPAAKTWLNSC